MAVEKMGPKPGDHYIELPYLEDWEPVPERRWAMAHLHADGSEDFEAFQREYLKRYPHMEMPGGYPCSIAPSVDHFLRTDHFGRRQDIDWELASMPLSDQEKAEMKEARERVKRQRRLEMLQSRGKEPESAEQIATRLNEREAEKKTITERMGA